MASKKHLIFIYLSSLALDYHKKLVYSLELFNAHYYYPGEETKK